MWFLFGLFVGLNVANGPGGAAGNALGSIPMRCLMAIEESDAAYARCRRPSIIGELAAGSSTYPGNGSSCWNVWGQRGAHRSADGLMVEQAREMCDVQWHIDLEVRALKRLNELAAAQAKR